MKYYHWFGIEAEAIAAEVETELQRAREALPEIDLTGAESDE
jgi:hypothetical protein